ncbi:porin family protein [Prevotella brunnea]|uniref:Porin family protein n=1 Tax=Prevotella brunnea TaxID=2508867 RepID=A0A5C8GJE0_9BACT|nr:porin family protein [Prevotella brunnea]MDR0186349.1 porin family protein [Prevotella brunnea]TXJ62082.1 porin family protein [Prevotella brunnea]
MKKVFTFALIFASLLFASGIKAQGVKFGVKAGLNVTDFHFSGDVFNKSNQAGGFVGPTVKFSLPLTGLGIDASALYDYRSAKLTDANGEEQTVKQQQIALPVNLRYAVGLGNTANLFFFAGPQWGINVGNKDFNWTYGSSYSLKNSSFSVNTGFGVTLLSHLQISANYNIAMGKTADVSFSNAASSTANAIVGKGKSRNNSWQIGLAYFF